MPITDYNRTWEGGGGGGVSFPSNIFILLPSIATNCHPPQIVQRNVLCTQALAIIHCVPCVSVFIFYSEGSVSHAQCCGSVTFGTGQDQDSDPRIHGIPLTDSNLNPSHGSGSGSCPFRLQRQKVLIKSKNSRNLSFSYFFA
jgi:hypothetical protein